MEFQNGRILNEMYHFYMVWGPFGPHHGLIRVNQASALKSLENQILRGLKYIQS